VVGGGDFQTNHTEALIAIDLSCYKVYPMWQQSIVGWSVTGAVHAAATWLTVEGRADETNSFSVSSIKAQTVLLPES